MSLIIDKKVVLSQFENCTSMAFTICKNNYENKSISNEYIYQGEIKDDEINGFGRLWNENISYSGYFKNNVFEGKGILINISNEKEEKYFVKYYDGDFVNGKKSGYGKEIYNNDEYYIGEFSNNLRHGKGILYNENGIVKIESNWERGTSINTESITEYYNNGSLKYKGKYDGINWEGKGVFSDKEGNLIFDGVFKLNKFLEGKLISKKGTKIFEGNFSTSNNYEIAYPIKGIVYDEKENKLLDSTFKLINADNDINLVVVESSKFYFNGNLIFEGIISQNSETFELAKTYINCDYFNKGINLRCKYFNGHNLIIKGYFGNGKVLSSNGNIIEINFNENFDGEIKEMNKENEIVMKTEFKNKKLNGEKYKKYLNQEISEIYNNGNIKSKKIHMYNVLTFDVTFDNNGISFKEYYPSKQLKFDGYGKRYGNDNNLIHPHGEGKMYFESGNLKYQGNFSNGKYDGAGTLYNQENKIYQGNFKEGSKHGQGTSYYENSGEKEYDGYWINNEKHGDGSLYSEEGTLVFTGTFHWDEMQFT